MAIMIIVIITDKEKGGQYERDKAKNSNLGISKV